MIVNYNEEFYKDLIEMGVSPNKARGALRLTNNNKSEAALISTDDGYDWRGKEYLCYDNDEVFTERKFIEKCLEAIKSEYPHLTSKEEIEERLSAIISMIKKNEKDEDNEDDNDIFSDKDDDDNNNGNIYNADYIV